MTVDPALLFNWLVSSPLATSYVGLTRADLYFTTRVNSPSWALLIASSPSDDDARAIALMEATRAIEAYPGISNKQFINYNSNQARYFPYHTVVNVQGQVESATPTTLVDATLADIASRPDDSWNYGSVRIIDGTGIGQIREITDFDSVTGTITVATWTTDPDTTSEYELVSKVPDEIIRACCEIAYNYIPDSVTGLIPAISRRQKLQAEGVDSFRVGKHQEKFEEGTFVNGYLIPPAASAILNKYITWFV